jgi:hypothetical protein
VLKERGRIDPGLSAEIPVGKIPGLFFLFCIKRVQEFSVIDEFKN